MAAKKKPADDTEGAAQAKPKRSLVKILLILLLSLGALAGGLTAAMGPEALLALLGGGDKMAEGDMPEGEMSGETPEGEMAGEKMAEGEAASEGGSEHDGEAKGEGKKGEGEGEGGEGEGEGEGSLMVSPFKEIIVNITSVTASGRQTSRFLKLNIALIYDEDVEGSDRVEIRKLYMRDSFQNYLRQLTERDLRGTIGVVTLKAELLRRARAVSESLSPQELLISDLIVQ